MSLKGSRNNVARGLSALDRSRLYFNAARHHLPDTGFRNGVVIGALTLTGRVLVALHAAITDVVQKPLEPKPRPARRKGARQ